MDTQKDKPSTIDEYIQGFPVEVQEILQSIRQVIREEAPEAMEKISYQIPTFYLYGNLIHFAAFQKHIGLYPSPKGIKAFEDKLSPYKRSKGSIQFPLKQPIPLELIREIVRYRLREQTQEKKK